MAQLSIVIVTGIEYAHSGSCSQTSTISIWYTQTIDWTLEYSIYVIIYVRVTSLYKYRSGQINQLLKSIRYDVKYTYVMARKPCPICSRPDDEAHLCSAYECVYRDTIQEEEIGATIEPDIPFRTIIIGATMDIAEVYAKLAELNIDKEKVHIVDINSDEARDIIAQASQVRQQDLITSPDYELIKEFKKLDTIKPIVLHEERGVIPNKYMPKHRRR